MIFLNRSFIKVNAFLIGLQNKMKILNVLFLFSLGLNFYFLTKEDEDVIVYSEQDEISVKLSGLKKKSMRKSKPLLSKSEFQKKKKVSDEPNRYYEQREESVGNLSPFEDVSNINPERQAKIEANWFNEVQEYFEYELNLSPAQIEEYQKLAIDRRVEIENYIGSLLKSRGNEDGYLALTMDEMMEVADINKSYSTRLAQTLGPEDYQAYQNLKREYNSSLSGKNDSAQFYIDF